MIEAGRYRCRDCGEWTHLMLGAVDVPVAVGGLHAPRFMVHGPGRRGQVWVREDVWATPDGVTPQSVGGVGQ